MLKARLRKQNELVKYSGFVIQAKDGDLPPKKHLQIYHQTALELVVSFHDGRQHGPRQASLGEFALCDSIGVCVVQNYQKRNV